MQWTLSALDNCTMTRARWQYVGRARFTPQIPLGTSPRHGPGLLGHGRSCNRRAIFERALSRSADAPNTRLQLLIHAEHERYLIQKTPLPYKCVICSYSEGTFSSLSEFPLLLRPPCWHCTDLPRLTSGSSERTHPLLGRVGVSAKGHRGLSAALSIICKLRPLEQTRLTVEWSLSCQRNITYVQQKQNIQIRYNDKYQTHVKLFVRQFPPKAPSTVYLTDLYVCPSLWNFLFKKDENFSWWSLKFGSKKGDGDFLLFILFYVFFSLFFSS